MANASIGGLVSGLDTATIISQLMQLEARPQTMLKSKVSSAERAVTALQTFNAKLAAIATKAGELSKAAAWDLTTAASTNDKVTVAADRGVSATSLTFSVDALASAARTTYSAEGTVSNAPTDVVMAANVGYTITYNDGRATETIDTGDGRIQSIADALNATDGLKATLVRSGVAADGTTPTYELHVESTTSGLDSGFSISETAPADPVNPVAFMGGTATQAAGTNARITLAGQTQPMEFTTNSITDLMPGVDVTLLAGSVGTSTTITVARDEAKLTESVKAMVEAVNAALSEIDSLTAYDATTKKTGLLGGDSTLRTVRNQLLESVSRGLAGESLSTVGIEVDRYGKLTFDEATFKSAYTADPSGASARFVGTDATPTDAKDPYDAAYGFADRLGALGKNFSDSVDGLVTQSIKSRQSQIRGWQDDIADWDVRLESRKTALQRQYTALESALGKLQSQGNWLAGQLAGLPSWNSGQ